MSEVISQPYLDESERLMVFKRVQDVEPIIERNKALQNTPQNRNAEFFHVASVPNIFLEQWLNEEWERGNVNLKLFSPEFNQLTMRKLKDPDWAWLRTTDKRL